MSDTHAKAKKSWKRCHRIPISDHIAIGTINVNGFSDSAKQAALSDLEQDVLAITETHLQSHLHRAFSDFFPEFHCIFTPDPEDRHYAGVALFIKKSRFWQVQPLKWSPTDDCHQFYRENRLLAAQAWYGNGGSSILFYCLYAPSGARWEQPKRKVFNQLLDSIVADVVSRGQIPAVILGDFNMTIEESDKFQELLNHNIFMDARQIASSEYRSSPTCYVGPNGGSCIDFLLTTPNIFDLYPTLPSHNYQFSKITVLFQSNLPCQHQYNPEPASKTFLNYLHFTLPLVMTNCPHVKLVRNFGFRLPRDWLMMLSNS